MKWLGWRVTAVVAALLSSACNDHLPGPAHHSIPHPDLRTLEPAVRTALETAIARLNEEPAATARERAAIIGQLGQLYHAHHFSAAARAAYAAAAELDGRDARWHYYGAVLAAEDGDTDAAISGFRGSIERDPAYLPAQLRLARVFHGAGDFAAAISAFERVLALAPGNAAALAGLGAVAVQQGRYYDALPLLQRALATDPGATQLHHPLAIALRQTGGLESAREHLAAAGTGQPAIDDPWLRSLASLSRSAQFYLQRGQQLATQGRYPEALADFRTAIETNPDDAAAHATLGQVLATLGEDDAARSAYEDALRLSPDYPAAHYFLGTLLEKSGASAAARQHYEQALAANPDYAQPRYLLAAAALREGQVAMAAEHYAYLGRLLPAQVEFGLWEGIARLANGECAPALAALQRAQGINPGYGPVLEALARAYATCPELAQAQREQALTLATLLYEARPDAASEQTLAMALAAVGRHADAAAAQARALALGVTPEGQLFAENNLARFRAGQQASAAWPAGVVQRMPGANRKR